MPAKISGIYAGRQSTKPVLLRLVVATAIAVSLCCVVLFVPFYPCGYLDANTQKYAGHGDHSLFTVLDNQFNWASDSVPVPSEKYTGSGPYMVEAGLWVAALYLPIFLAIAYLGWMIFSRLSEILALLKKENPNPLSTRSGTRRL
jgi:hypothetical protein